MHCFFFFLYLAVHLNFSPIVPQWVWAVKALPDWIVSMARERLPGEMGKNVRKLDGFYNSMAYYWIQQHRPQQLATALVDSPVGLLSWLSFFWGLQIGTTPSFSEENMLIICTIYFLTRWVINQIFLNEPLLNCTSCPSFQFDRHIFFALPYQQFLAFHPCRPSL